MAEVAATVGRMLLVLLGIVIGVAVGTGKISGLDVLGTSIADAAVSLGYEAVGATVRISGIDPESTVAVVATTVLVALMPGIVSGILMGTARSGAVLRRVGSLIAVVAAAGALFSLDTPERFVAAGALLVVGLLFAFVVGSVLSIVASAVSAMMATVQIREAIAGDLSRFETAAGALSGSVGIGDVLLWSQVLSVAAAILPVIVLWSALRD